MQTDNSTQLASRCCDTYVTTLTSTSTNTPTCPYHKSRKLTPLDEADVLTLSRSYPRKLSLSIISLTNKYNIEHPNAFLTPISMCQRLGKQHNGFNHMNTPVTPLNVVCSSCASTFQVLRTDPTCSHTPPIYCIYCQQPTISITQLNTEDTAYTVLAETYSLRLDVVKALYDRWSRQSNLTHFSEYMQSEPVQQILSKLQQLV